MQMLSLLKADAFDLRVPHAKEKLFMGAAVALGQKPLGIAVADGSRA